MVFAGNLTNFCGGRKLMQYDVDRGGGVGGEELLFVL